MKDIALRVNPVGTDFHFAFGDPPSAPLLSTNCYLEQDQLCLSPLARVIGSEIQSKSVRCSQTLVSIGGLGSQKGGRYFCSCFTMRSGNPFRELISVREQWPRWREERTWVLGASLEYADHPRLQLTFSRNTLPCAIKFACLYPHLDRAPEFPVWNAYIIPPHLPTT